MSTESTAQLRTVMFAFICIAVAAYFVCPTWASAFPWPTARAFAAGLIHLFVLWWMLLWWWRHIREDATPLADEWTWRELRSGAGITLGTGMLALAMWQVYLASLPLLSRSDEPVQANSHLLYFDSIAGLSPASMVGMLGSVLIVAVLLIWTLLRRMRTQSDRQQGRYTAVLEVAVWLVVAVLLLLHHETAPAIRHFDLIRWPPVGTLAGALSHAILGRNEIAARLPSVVFYLLTGLYVFRIAAATTGRWLGTMAALLCLTAPILFGHGHLVFRTTGGAFFAAAAVFYGIRYMKHHRPLDVGLFSLAVTLAYLERRPSLIVLFVIPAAMVLWVLYRRADRPYLSADQALAVYGGALAVIAWTIAPWVYRTRDIRPYHPHLANLLDPELVSAYARALPGALGWPLTALLIVGGIVAIGRRRMTDLVILCWFAGVYFLFTFDDPSWVPVERFTAHLAAPAALLAVAPLSVLLDTRKVPLVAALLPMLILSACPLIASATDHPVVAWALPDNANIVQADFSEERFPFDDVAEWFQRNGSGDDCVCVPAFWQNPLHVYLRIRDLQDKVDVKVPLDYQCAPEDISELRARCRALSADYILVPEPVTEWLRREVVSPAVYRALARDEATGFSLVARFSYRDRRLVLSRVQ